MDLGVRGVNGTRVRNGARCMVRGVNRVRDRDGVDVWLGGSIGLGIGMGLDVGLGIGMGLGLVVGVLFFLRNTPSPKNVGNYLVGKN